MSQDLEKYLYFTVGLLKNSFALDALSQDALKYHLIDQPGKLIALRLTEYYEMVARGNLHPGASIPLTATSTPFGNGDGYFYHFVWWGSRCGELVAILEGDAYAIALDALPDFLSVLCCRIVESLQQHC